MICFQAKHSPQDHQHHHGKKQSAQKHEHSHKQPKIADSQTQYDYRQPDNLENKHNSDGEESESTQYLTAYKTYLSSSQPQVTSFSPKYQSVNEHESKTDSDTTNLVRSSSNLSNVSNVSNSSDSTIRITTKMSAQNQLLPVDSQHAITTTTSTQIKSLDEYLINNFRPFNHVSQNSLKTSSINSASPKSTIQINQTRNLSQSSGSQTNPSDQKYSDYLSNLRLSLQNVNETVNETTDFKIEKHFTGMWKSSGSDFLFFFEGFYFFQDLETDGDENFDRLNSQSRSRSADLIMSRKKKHAMRKENEWDFLTFNLGRRWY